MPTVEFKSARELRHEKWEKNIAGTSASHSFEVHVVGAERQKCLAHPPNPRTMLHSSADEAETDYYSDGDVSITPSSYVQACIHELSTSKTKVLRKCEEEGLTHHFMSLIEQIACGKLPVTNMAFLLSL